MLEGVRCTGEREVLRAKPVSPAGEVSCESGGWAHTLVAAIRELVISTGRMSVDAAARCLGVGYRA